MKNSKLLLVVFLSTHLLGMDGFIKLEGGAPSDLPTLVKAFRVALAKGALQAVQSNDLCALYGHSMSVATLTPEEEDQLCIELIRRCNACHEGLNLTWREVRPKSSQERYQLLRTFLTDFEEMHTKLCEMRDRLDRILHGASDRSTPVFVDELSDRNQCHCCIVS